MNLITGAGRGLGLAMHRHLGGIPFTRGTPIEAIRRNAPYDLIVHCAVNTAKAVPVDDALGYVQDNVSLTGEMISIPHRRFVYISSVDVYRRTDQLGLYASCKLISETMVMNAAHRPLIIRPTTLLGNSMRPNTIYRMLTEPAPKLYLAESSSFNFVLHQDICEFVEAAVERGIGGAVDFASDGDLTLGGIAVALGLAPCFGQHHYQVPHVEGAQRRTSAETLNLFIDRLGSRYIGKGRL